MTVEFEWSEEQQQLRETIVRFARRVLSDGLSERDRDATFSRDAWKQCASLGIQGINLPPEYGGGGADVRTTIVALEALGYGCADNGLIFSINAHMWAVQHPILTFGTEDQILRWLPGLADGSLIGAHAMSEPDSGSDAFSLASTASRDGADFVLRGSKVFATNAPVADVFLVFALTDPTAGFLGISAFIVERDRAGLSLGPPTSKMGLRTSPMSEIFLDDVRVPSSNVLGKLGRGAQVFNTAMERERSLILASTIGSMERSLETSVEYARSRRQFGQPVSKFQSVANRIVDMKLRLETARLLLYRLGWLLDQGRSVGLEAALVKLHLSESYVATALDTLAIHGGYGYTADPGIEREVRDALGSRIYSGTSDIQRSLAARLMRL